MFRNEQSYLRSHTSFPTQKPIGGPHARNSPWLRWNRSCHSEREGTNRKAAELPLELREILVSGRSRRRSLPLPARIHVPDLPRIDRRRHEARCRSLRRRAPRARTQARRCMEEEPNSSASHRPRRECEDRPHLQCQSQQAQALNLSHLHSKTGSLDPVFE
jgi:hypothetical protein